MPARAQGRAGASAAPDLAALDRVSDAVESGAGLPEVARSAGAALGASVIVLDSTSSVLAVACASSDEERAVMAGEGGTQAVELRVAGSPVGTRRYRPRGDAPATALLRMVAALIALEVERARAPERASEAAVRGLGGGWGRRRGARTPPPARGGRLAGPGPEPRGAGVTGGRARLARRLGRDPTPRARARRARARAGRGSPPGGQRP